MRKLNWKEYTAAANDRWRTEAACNADKATTLCGSSQGIKGMNLFRVVAAVCCGLIASRTEGAIKPSEATGLPDYDVRATAAASPAANVQAETRLKELVPGAKVERDKLLGVPRFISAPRGFLSTAGNQSTTNCRDNAEQIHPFDTL